MDKRCAEIVQTFQLHEIWDDGDITYLSNDRRISEQEAEWVCAGARNRLGAEMLEQGGFATGADWYLCRKDDLVVLVITV